MTGLSQLLNTGVSGLMAAAEAMQAVSNNTANVNTPGYNVESLNQSEIPGINGEPGIGTEVTSVGRAFSQFAFQQLVQAGSANQAAQTAQTSTQSLTALFPVASGGQGGLGAALSNFFAAASAITQDPTNSADRQSFVNDAQSLAATFNSLGSQLRGNLTSINGQIGDAVQQVNQLASQIATLNNSIAAQSASQSGAPPSLLDQRDALVQQLGQEIGITIDQGANGTEDIYTGGGAALVTGGSSLTLAATSTSDGNISVSYALTGQDLTDKLSGGTIGGLLSARSQISDARNAVGGLAVSLADAVNTQQSLGLDLNGNLGGPIFSFSGPQAKPAASNTGNATLSASITDTNAFTPADFTITRTASGYEALNQSTGQTTALGSGPALSLDGMTINVSGTAATGDSFLLQPTADSAETLKAVITNPAAVAAAAPYVVSPGSNAGNVSATVGSPQAASALPAGTVTVGSSQFGQDLSIKFTSATSFDVLSSTSTVLGTGTYSPTNGAEIAIRYPSPAPSGTVVTVSLSAGTAAAGDTFSLTPGGSGSNGNMVAMADLADQSLAGGTTLASAYASLVGTVGSNGQSAQVAAQAAQGVLTQAQAVQQSVSGVNLDEEAAKLVNFQQAYQAAATVIGTAQTLFQTLIQAVQA